MKRTLCILLALLAALSMTGCRFFNRPKPADNTAEPTLAPTAVATEAAVTNEAPEVTETVSEAPTAEPVQIESEADKAFRELDLEIFREVVTSSSDTYNQFIVSDPGKFGIDPADVSRGWGDFTYESHVQSMDYDREILSRLNAIDRSHLNELNGYAYDALKRTFETDLLYEDY